MTPFILQDKIHIRNLLLEGIIGILKKERVTPQPLIFNLTLYKDLSPAGESDDIKDTVNYAAIVEHITLIVKNTQFFLIEKLATHIADSLLLTFNIDHLSITIDKPQALTLADSAAIEISRSKSP